MTSFATSRGVRFICVARLPLTASNSGGVRLPAGYLRSMKKPIVTPESPTGAYVRLPRGGWICGLTGSETTDSSGRLPTALDRARSSVVET